MIRFVKTLKYPLECPGTDTFDYLAEVTSQKADPRSLEPNKLMISAGTVFHSTLRRVVECLNPKEGVILNPMRSLVEIPFSLERLCTKAEWLQYKSVIVRKRFKQAFVEDTLLLGRKTIFQEIQQVLALAKEASLIGEVCVVSHSFRMKLIEAYIQTSGGIVDDPILIDQFLIDDQKTYQFGEGFEIET